MLGLFLIAVIAACILLFSLKIKNNTIESFKENKFHEGWNCTYKDKSQWQTIELYEKDKEFLFMLNEQIQVYSGEYEMSHNIQCSLPVKKFRPKNILILGGGDLIAASCCLKFDFVESVTVVEIDDKVIEMVKKNNLMRKITKNAHEDKRLKIIVGDALSYIENCKIKFDMIIEDIEIDFTNQEMEMDRSTFITNCIRVAPIYIGSIPDYNVVKNSKVHQIAQNKTDQYHTMNKRKQKILEDLKFDKKDIRKLRGLFKDCDISVAAYNYGVVYGDEAYLMIKK